MSIKLFFKTTKVIIFQTNVNLKKINKKARKIKAQMLECKKFYYQLIQNNDTPIEKHIDPISDSLQYSKIITDIVIIDHAQTMHDKKKYIQNLYLFKRSILFKLFQCIIKFK